jgi:glyoxylase-like metal-dependent hydrolase (beta-lactamase superfamily II)
VKTQEVISEGGSWEPMQAIEPDGEPRIINTFLQTTRFDYEKRRLRIDFNANRAYPAPLNFKFTEVVDGDVAMLETADASGKVIQERLHPSRFATRLRDSRRSALRLLYTAKAAPDLKRDADILTEGKTTMVAKFTDAGMPVEVHISSFDKLPVRVIYHEDDPIYGDTANELAFSDWKDVGGGLRLPQTMDSFLNGNKIQQERVRNLLNNPESVKGDLFLIPDAVRSSPELGKPTVSQWPLRRIVMGVSYEDFGREQKVELNAVAPGVFHVVGSSHHSMVVEMKDHLVLVEMPLYEERSLAVIKAVEEKFPGKPIKYAVMSHFHIDHSGGVRAYAAKGVTIIAPQSILPWLKTVFERPKTSSPDALTNSANRNAVVEGVATEPRILTDGERTIEIRAVPNPHVGAMLAVYLPKEKVLFESDLFNPGTPVDPENPNALALYDWITGSNLQVDRLVGGHGGTGAFRDFARGLSPALKSQF